MKVSYHGHSIVMFEVNGKKIIIDPFITGNPVTDLNAEDVKVDYILLTHGHNDHVGDALALAKRNDALIIGSAEMQSYFSWQGAKAHGMNIGGSYQFDFGRVKFTQAYHSSSYETGNNEIIYLGMPMGILLNIENKWIYHAGDTGLFSDMKLIGERHPIDLAFLPIGDNFTMGPEDAALAAQFLKAKTVVPIHYNTFPIIQQDPKSFVTLLPEGVGKLMEVGDSLEL